MFFFVRACIENVVFTYAANTSCMAKSYVFVHASPEFFVLYLDYRYSFILEKSDFCIFASNL